MTALSHINNLEVKKRLDTSEHYSEEDLSCLFFFKPLILYYFFREVSKQLLLIVYKNADYKVLILGNICALLTDAVYSSFTEILALEY